MVEVPLRHIMISLETEQDQNIVTSK
jgi:hypothetical protein